MPAHGYLVVEGVHDVRFAYRLLKSLGFSQVQLSTDLNPYWLPLVPEKFPYRGDLLKRVPVPLFVRGDLHEIAIHAAEGETRIAETIQETIASLPLNSLSAIGVILDADKKQTPSHRFATLLKEFHKKGISFPAGPGIIERGPPDVGGFVVPDNKSQGTLETLLLDCASAEYPHALKHAENYIDLVDQWRLSEKDLKHFRKDAGRNKAIIGAIASVLRPGKAIQVSIEDNEWLGARAMALPSIQNVMTFLTALFGLPPATPFNT